MLAKLYRVEHGRDYLGQHACSQNGIGSNMDVIILANIGICMLAKPYRVEHGRDCFGQDGCSQNRIRSNMGGIILADMRSRKTR